MCNNKFKNSQIVNIRESRRSRISGVVTEFQRGEIDRSQHLQQQKISSVSFFTICLNAIELY